MLDPVAETLHAAVRRVCRPPMEKSPSRPNRFVGPPQRPLGTRRVTDADFRHLIDSVSDYAIFLLDVNGVVQTWNDGARRLKGYADEDVIGQHFSMFYPHDVREKGWPEHELREAARLGRFEDEGWRLRKDGTRFWANVVITRLVLPTGELRGFSKITRDLTDRRRYEELVRHSEERFRLLVDNVRDFSIFMLDPAGYIVSWNSGAQKISGYSADEVIGKHFSMFYPNDPTLATAPEAELRSALDDGHFEDEGWRMRKDGARYWARVVLTPVLDETGRHRGFAKVQQDLTQMRRVSALEDEGRRLTDFLAMLGHELRNPLAPIAHVSGLLDREPKPSKTLAVAREVLRRQLQQITRLVDDLLDVGRITTGKVRVERKLIDARDVVRQAIEMSKPAMELKGHRFSQDAGNEPAWVTGDRARLVQVVGNLLGNAVKFTPRSGEIRVCLARTRNAVEIRVKDNGAGIPLNFQEGVFDLFVQGRQDSSRPQGGLGLGLSLAKHLVSLHDGQLELYSPGIPGKGAEFVVRLPRAHAPKNARLRAPSDPPRVLVVDDNVDAANTLLLLLEALGYEGRAVYDGEEALDAIARDPPDVVLLDLGLPNLSGLQVAEQVLMRLVEAPPMIAVTGYNQPSDREATQKAGFAAHLPKPVELARLTHVLDQIAPISAQRASP